VPRKKKKKPLYRRLLPYLLVLACALLAVGAVYTVFLDFQVRERFEGARWTLPAKVYAQPIELYVGQSISRHRLTDSLERQGYRQLANTPRPGSFSRQGSSVNIHSRAFTFWDGAQAAERFRVSFNGDRISGMRSLDRETDIPLQRLEPMLIGSIYPTQGEDRILVKLGDVPPMLPAGLIIVEDRQFMEHHGVSPKGILRAAIANAKAGRVVQGGSTITQQLVKNFYLNNDQTLVRKGKEAIMAILLDAHYAKENILEAYLNEVYLGQDGGRAIHGFGLGSYFYFRKPLEELQPEELALLVGMVKGPSYYNPRRFPDRARKRRNLVLEMFRDAGFLNDAETTRAQNEPLGVSRGSSRSTTQYPAFIDLVKKQLKGHYRDSDLTEEGLRVFTTLDPFVQETLEEQVSSGVEQLERRGDVEKKSLQAAAVVTSIENGRVLGLVGGRDASYAGFNRALDAQRQIGSLMKPVVYLTALENPSKYSLVTPVDDSPLQVRQPNGDIWEPENYDRRSHGTHVPLYQALVHSYNLATSRLALEVGLPRVVENLKALGYPGEPMAVPSLALGAVEMSPLEVAQIYNTLAGGGYQTPLLAIQAVTTREGEPLSRYSLKTRRAVNEQSVYLLNWAMQRVVREGTARSAYNRLPSQLNLAGKTGTSNDLRDSWFAGYSGDAVAVVWVGRDDNKPGKLAGASGALPLWSGIMAEIGPRSFDPPRPEGLEVRELLLGDDRFRGSRGPNSVGGRDCSRAVKVPFVEDYVPDGLIDCSEQEERGAYDESVTSPEERRDEDDSNWLRDLFR